MKHTQLLIDPDQYPVSIFRSSSGSSYVGWILHGVEGESPGAHRKALTRLELISFENRLFMSHGPFAINKYLPNGGQGRGKELLS